jgi:hypothetical protein
VTTRAREATSFIGFSRKLSMAGPTQKTKSASCSAFACDGFNAYVCGDPAPSIISDGVPMPPMTAETREWMGLIDVTTLKPSEAQAKLDEKIAVAISVTFAIRIFFNLTRLEPNFLDVIT